MAAADVGRTDLAFAAGGGKGALNTPACWRPCFETDDESRGDAFPVAGTGILEGEGLLICFDLGGGLE